MKKLFKMLLSISLFLIIPTPIKAIQIDEDIPVDTVNFVVSKIENIIREEMNKSGALELGMPLLINEDYFIKSGRINSFGEEMFSLDSWLAPSA